MKLIDLPEAGPEFASLSNPRYLDFMSKNVKAYIEGNPNDDRSPGVIAAAIEQEAWRALTAVPQNIPTKVGYLAVENS